MVKPPYMGGEKMKCPICGAGDTRVIETRTADEDRIVRRRRECVSCLSRFTTYERLEPRAFLWVVKKDGRREAFDREKLLKGMAKACEKLPVPLEKIEGAVAEIEDSLRNTGQGEISSERVGELAMEKLRGLHQVAYVRFASVYREFTDLSGFTREISKLLEERDEKNGR
jgi:transcriptional repressor NrdR